MVTKDYHLQVADFKLRFCSLVFLLFVCTSAESSFAQTNFDNFTEIFKRGNTEQKREALFQIRNLATAEASRTAIPALQDADEIVRATAVSSVIFLSPDEAIPNLIPLLADKKELVRRETAYALGKVKSPNAINPLIKLLQKDKVAEVRNAAIVALGQIGDASAVTELVKLLQKKPNGKDDFLRRSASRSIGQIAQIIQTGVEKVTTPKDFLPDKYQIAVKRKYSNLIESFPPFRDANITLIQILQSPKESDDSKREAAFALGEIGDAAAIPVLQSNINAKDYYLAQISRNALNKIKIQANIQIN